MWYFWLLPSSWTALLNVLILWQMYHCCAATTQRFWSVRPLWWEFKTTVAQRTPSSRWHSTTTGTSPVGQPLLIGQAILPCPSHTSHPLVASHPLETSHPLLIGQAILPCPSRTSHPPMSSHPLETSHPLLIGQAVLPCPSRTSHPLVTSHPPVTTLAPCQIVTLLQWTHPVHHCTVVLITEEPHLTSTAVLTATALLQNSTVPSQTMTVPHHTMAIQVLLLTVTTALHLIMVVVHTKHLCLTSAWVSCATFCFFIDVNEISAFMNT